MTGTVSAATADEPEVDAGGLALGLRRQLFADEHALAVDADCAPAEVVEHLRNAGVDLVIQHVLDDPDGLLIGDAQPVDEPRLQPCVAHALRDRLAAAVDEHGVDAHRLQEDHVAQESLDHVVVVHRAAAILDDEELSAEFLDERERLDQGFGACERRSGHLGKVSSGQ
jgi:hypothetical protein